MTRCRSIVPKEWGKEEIAGKLRDMLATSEPHRETAARGVPSEHELGIWVARFDERQQVGQIIFELIDVVDVAPAGRRNTVAAKIWGVDVGRVLCADLARQPE